MENITITVLRCPLCGVDLDGFDRDVIYFCRSCHHGYMPDGRGKFGEIPVFYQPPTVDVKASSLIWLPVWALKIKKQIEAPRKVQKRVGQLIDKISFVWVTAFRGWRASYFGDPGLFYTANALAPKLLPATEETLPVGCSTTIVEAREYPSPFLLSIVDRAIDVAHIEIFTEVVESALISVPFLDMGDQIHDTQIDWKWPHLFVEDIVSIRKRRD